MATSAPTAYDLKQDHKARITEGVWELFWHPGREVYVVRPDVEGREYEGDEFSRLADAIGALRSYARCERAR